MPRKRRHPGRNRRIETARSPSGPQLSKRFSRLPGKRALNDLLDVWMVPAFGGALGSVMVADFKNGN
jgi:hypothetical protein